MTNATPGKADIRLELLGVDQFVREHPAAFLAAFGALTDGLHADIRPTFHELITGYASNLSSPDFAEKSPIEMMPMFFAALFLITFFHLTVRAPLYIDDTLMTLWIRPDSANDPRFCVQCGYLFPAPLETCNLCVVARRSNPIGQLSVQHLNWCGETLESISQRKAGDANLFKRLRL